MLGFFMSITTFPLVSEGRLNRFDRAGTSAMEIGQRFDSGGLLNTWVCITVSLMSEFNSKMTFMIDAAVKKRFKVACLQSDTEMSEEIRSFIEHRTEELERQAKAAKPKK
jgi:hypothetical protein